MSLVYISDDLSQRVLGYPRTQPPRRISQHIANICEQWNLKDSTNPVEIPYPTDLGTFDQVLADAVKLLDPEIALLEQLATMPIPAQLPDTYPIKPGTYQYTAEGWIPMVKPLGDICILDFETVNIKEEIWLPYCYAALDPCGTLYVNIADLDDLSPTVSILGHRVIVGHNVPYDRSFITEEYDINPSGNKFIDTMALWIAVRGCCNQQRPLLKMAEKDPYLKNGLQWVDDTTTNGLAAVHKYYYPDRAKLDKDIRDEMIKGGIQYVRSHFQDILKYCMSDVIATLEVFQKIWAEFREAQPSNVSLAGQMLLGSVWVPMSPTRFPPYYAHCEQMVADIRADIGSYIAERCKAVVDQWLIDGIVDPQLAHLIWTPAKSGKNKGLPEWYRKIDDYTLGKRWVAGILGLQWQGQPIMWGNLSEYGIDGEGYYTVDGALDHPEDPGKRLTDLFVKGYVKHWESGVLSTKYPETKPFISKKMSTLNWVSLRKRVRSIKAEDPYNLGYPVVLPRITVTGTITRRAADSLWQVLPNPNAERIGTELKALIEAPPGYKLVGADVDSQEAWIAGIFGDSLHGYCGSTPLGMMNIVGSKEARTDIHSAVSDRLKINRTLAKSLNYGVVYGLGLAGAIAYIMKSALGITRQEAQAFAESYIKFFKGSKTDTGKYYNGIASDCFNKMEEILRPDVPRTVLSKTALSHALRTKRDFKTTRINWTIQSSGVDYRDMWILLLTYLFRRYSVGGRLLMTIHDELRWLVPEDQVNKAAYLFQVAHIIIRGAFIDALALDGIPAGVAWHTGIDIDTVWRKESDLSCQTPSHQALPSGYTLTPQDIANYRGLDK